MYSLSPSKLLGRGAWKPGASCSVGAAQLAGLSSVPAGRISGRISSCLQSKSQSAAPQVSEDAHVWSCCAKDLLIRRVAGHAQPRAHLQVRHAAAAVHAVCDVASIEDLQH